MKAVRITGLLEPLTNSQQVQLNQWLSEAPLTAMPHEVAVRLQLSRPRALALLAELAAANACEMLLFVYHECDPDVVMMAVPTPQGFPALPIACSLCERSVEDPAELSYELAAKIDDVVKLL